MRRVGRAREWTERKTERKETELKGKSPPHPFSSFLQKPARGSFSEENCWKAWARARERSVLAPRRACIHTHTHTPISLISFSSKRKLWTLYLHLPYTSLNTTAYSVPRSCIMHSPPRNTRACAHACLYTYMRARGGCKEHEGNIEGERATCWTGLGWKRTCKTDVLAIFHFRRKNLSRPFPSFPLNLTLQRWNFYFPSLELARALGFSSNVNIRADYIYSESRRIAEQQWNVEGILFFVSDEILTRQSLPALKQ